MNQTKSAEILYFTSPSCLFCNVVEHRLRKIINETKLHTEIQIREIDVTKEPHLAEQHRVLACPTLVFPGLTRIVGNVEKDELFSVVFQYYTHHHSSE